MKLRLAHVLPTLPRYQNNFNKGPYKNGNYSQVTILVDDYRNTRMVYDANEFPRELLEAPYYVKALYPVVTSCYHSNAPAGLKILLDKENNNYDR